jgi:hypothetical protein
MIAAVGDQGHGSRRRYQLGCKCGPCVAANRLYQVAVRAGGRGSPSARMAAFTIELDPLDAGVSQ